MSSKEETMSYHQYRVRVEAVRRLRFEGLVLRYDVTFEAPNQYGSPAGTEDAVRVPRVQAFQQLTDVAGYNHQEAHAVLTAAEALAPSEVVDRKTGGVIYPARTYPVWVAWDGLSG